MDTARVSIASAARAGAVQSWAEVADSAWERATFSASEHLVSSYTGGLALLTKKAKFHDIRANYISPWHIAPTIRDRLIFLSGIG